MFKTLTADSAHLQYDKNEIWSIKRRDRGEDFIARYINMSEFTCTKRSNDSSFFCYFCLKAGAERSRVRGKRQNKQFYSTILAFHHITKGGEACRERERKRESENCMERFYFICVQVEVLRDRSCSTGSEFRPCYPILAVYTHQDKSQ